MLESSILASILWVILPYVVVMTFIIGNIYRYVFSQQSWSSRSSEIFEERLLRIGGQLFHYGLLLVIFGHILGLFIPPSITAALGISDEEYHMIAIAMGGTAGGAALLGSLILLWRRLADPRVRATSSSSDTLILILIVLTMMFGEFNTVVYSALHGPYDYRSTIAPWIRSLFYSPNPSLMTSVPLTYKIHIFLAYLVFFMWPFSRLVHVWSVPIFYLRRPWILYRRLERYE
ncbi:MAG: respiratory nitrate reductase subunit gamma [Fervidicoccaceae archaeon]